MIIESKQGGTKKKSLRQSDVNVLVKAMRDGATWDEAKASLIGVDVKAIDGWRSHVEAEVAKRPSDFKPRPSVEEAEDLTAELEAAHIQLKEAISERDAAGEKAGELQGLLTDANEAISRLTVERDSLLSDLEELRTVKDNTAASLAQVAKERDAALAEIENLKELLPHPSKKK